MLYQYYVRFAVLRPLMIVLAVSTLVAGGASAASADVNFIHLAPFDPAQQAMNISLHADGEPVADLVRYRESTKYLSVDATSEGRFHVSEIEVHSPAESNVTAISSQFSFEPGAHYSVIAVGDGANYPLQLLQLEDEPSRAAAGVARIRIVHAAPFAPQRDQTALSVRNGAGEVVGGLGELRYGSNSGFLSLLPGTYQLEFADPRSGELLLTPRPLGLSSGDVYTLFISGDGDNVPLGLLRVDAEGVGTELSQPMPSIHAMSGFGGWLGYLAIGLVLACFVGVKMHRRESTSKRPSRRVISVRNI